MKFGKLFLVLGCLASGGIASAGPIVQHFVYLFAYDDGQQTPSRNHTWASFVEVTWNDGAAPAVSTHTINWMPRNLEVNVLALGPQRGTNVLPAQTFQWATKSLLPIGKWGPYQISDELYDLAVKAQGSLESGQTWFRVLDTDERIFKVLDPTSVPEPRAVSDLHAISDIVTSVDKRGYLLTGLKLGFAATDQIALHLAPWYVRQGNNASYLAPVDYYAQQAMDSALELANYRLQSHGLIKVETNYCSTAVECRKKAYDIQPKH